MRERRKYVRLRAPIGVAYKIVKGPKTRSKSTLRDISGGGLMLVANENLRAGDLLDLEIHIPLSGEPIQAVGEVVWFTAGDGRDRQREAGVKFRDIDPQELHRILEYVHTVAIG